jgi:mRNA interferase RelE/StbE
MATHRISLKPFVEKDLRSLPKSMVARIMKRIGVLADEPFPRQSVELAGTEELYRIRIGDYRVVCGVDKPARQVIVDYVRHRREVYRQV